MLTIKFDSTRIKQQFADMPEAIDKTVRATFKNTLAFGDLKPVMEGLMTAQIDNPTKFTANGKGVAFYDKVADSGPLQATFGMKGMQAAYLQFMLKGVPRDQKIIERRTPDGRLLIPTTNVPLDRHGNVPRAFYLNAFRQAFYNSENSPYFFLPQQRGKLPAGIYARTTANTPGTDKPQPQLQFRAVNAMPYKKAWDFWQAAEREILERLPGAMEEAIAFRLKKLQTQQK